MGGPAKQTNKVIIGKYDKRPLPEGWQHTHLSDHLRFKGQPMRVRDRGKGMTELQAGNFDDRVTVLGGSLEEAMKKMEQKLRLA